MSMTAASPAASTAPPVARGRLAVPLLAGTAVALSLGVYGRVHHAAGRPVFALGFSGVLQMKAWLSTAVLVLILVQLTTALAMWGRLPGVTRAPASVALVHRWSGSVAFVLSLPVAFHCVWSLGLATGNLRVAAHGVAGCAFYGAYAAKMLGLRTPRLPGWALPVLGGAVLSTFAVAWLTASLWFFTRSGIALT
jgi:hypothetical protein